MVPRARERSSCTMQLRYLLPLYQCTCSVPLYLQCTFTCICTCNCKCTCINSSLTCTFTPRLKTYGSRWATSLPTEACSTQVKYVTSQTLNIDIKAPYVFSLEPQINSFMQLFTQSQACLKLKTFCENIKAWKKCNRWAHATCLKVIV